MLSPDERQELDSDISNWTWEMQSRERDLDEGKSTLISDPSSQPEIRTVKLGVAKVCQYSDIHIQCIHFVKILTRLDLKSRERANED